MRMVASKAIETHSQGVIAKFNDQIAFSCRVYGKARAAMVRLGADYSILNKFCPLSKEDVKASTSVLKPNIPGSSNLHLLWIWQSGPQDSGPEMMHECECIISGLGSDMDVKSMHSSVQRVHWLCARAQKNRWEEELTLVKYEMEWTARYFLYWASQWNDKFNDPSVQSGPKAYAARQAAQWTQMALSADRVFLIVNRDYHLVVM